MSFVLFDMDNIDLGTWINYANYQQKDKTNFTIKVFAEKKIFFFCDNSQVPVELFSHATYVRVFTAKPYGYLLQRLLLVAIRLASPNHS